MEARALLLQDLQNRTKSSAGDWSSSSRKEEAPSEEDESSSEPETEKHPVVAAEMRIVDKSVIEEDAAAPIHRGKDVTAELSPAPAEKYEDNGDEWPEDESTAVEIAGARIISVPIADDEDVSFSDLEEDDDEKPPQPRAAAADPPATASKGGKPIAPDAKDSNEWSDLDDIDAI